MRTNIAFAVSSLCILGLIGSGAVAQDPCDGVSTSDNTTLERVLTTDLPALEAELEAAGAPWTPGRRLP